MRLVEIQGTDIELTPGLREYVNKRLERVAALTEKFEPCDIRVELELTSKHHKKGQFSRAEFNLTLPGRVIRADNREHDMYAAIDKAVDELKLQVKEYKSRLQDQSRRKAEVPEPEEEY